MKSPSQGESITLPLKEFELLFKLASYLGQTFSRDQLIEDIWGYSYEGNERTLDVHINRLRDRFPESRYSFQHSHNSRPGLPNGISIMIRKERLQGVLWLVSVLALLVVDFSIAFFLTGWIYTLIGLSPSPLLIQGINSMLGLAADDVHHSRTDRAPVPPPNGRWTDENL